MSDDDQRAAVHRSVEALWRIESGRVIAALARITGDIGTAEDFAQDALAAALERWPVTGVPPNPGGWLMTTRSIGRSTQPGGARWSTGRCSLSVGRPSDALTTTAAAAHSRTSSTTTSVTTCCG
jgi:hypothetical protein